MPTTLGIGLGLSAHRDGGGFTPASVPGLLADIDPAGMLWQDAARTTPAAADGDSVGSCLYAAGSYVTAAGGVRPTLKLNVRNGHPSLRHNGSQQLYDASWSQTGPRTVYVVGRDTANPGLWLDSASTAANRVFLVRSSTASIGEMTWSAGTDAIGGWTVANEFTILDAVLDGADSVLGLAGYEIPGSAGSNVWAGLRVGGHPTVAHVGINGDILRLLIYDGGHSLGTRRRIRGHLSSRYAVGLLRGIDVPGVPVLDRDGDHTGPVSVTATDAAFEQNGLIDPSTYIRWDGSETPAGQWVNCLMSIDESDWPDAVAYFTKEEAQHAGLCICNADPDNNYILMFSIAASLEGQRALQLVKQVGGTESPIPDPIGSAWPVIPGLSFGTVYWLRMKLTAGVLDCEMRTWPGGVLLGSISQPDASFTTGEIGVHGFATRNRTHRVWIG